MDKLGNIIKGKKVVFISTKNIDYIRNTQEINAIKNNASDVKYIYSKSKSYFVRILQIYFKILFSSFRKYDTVFVGFAPQLIIPVFKFKFRKNQVVIDFFISVYDTMAFDRKKFRPESIPGKLCKWLDTRTLKCSDHIITDTKAHARYFVDDLGAVEDKICVEYLEADTDIFYPRDLEKPKNLKGKYIVLYFGSILPLQGIETILDAIRIMKDEKDIFFYIIGPVDNKTNTDNVEYIQWLSQEKLADYIDIADLCLAGHFNANINKALRTIPGKAYIYEAMNKKMILGENSATHELFSEDDRHYFVEMGNPQKLVDVIHEIKNAGCEV